MTGFGKSSLEVNGKKLTVEVRTLNSKQLDISIKMPWMYREKEIEIRNIINNRLDRGKIDYSLNVDVLDDQNVPTINRAAVKNYYNQLSEVAGELYIDSKEQMLSIIMRLPETLRSEKVDISPEEWELLSNLTDQAIAEVDGHRKEEGRAMAMDLELRISNILKLLGSIEPLEAGRMSSVRERLVSALKSAGTENIDQNRFEQELIFYLEKMDFNEEKVRLRKHCEYFMEEMASEADTGKKLAFISQELGREINTLGSKANDAAIQKIVVNMKDELEKIKEQVLNIL